MAETIAEEGVWPEVGRIDSQFPPDCVATADVQLSAFVVPPLLLMVSVCGAITAPVVPAKLSALLLTVMVGSVTLRVTAIVTVFDAPAEEMRMEPVYVPFGSVPVATEMVVLAGVVPEAGETLSQLPPEGVVTEAVAFQARGAPDGVALPIEILCDAAEPPATPVNVSVLGDAVRLAPGVSVSVTLMI